MLTESRADWTLFWRQLTSVVKEFPVVGEDVSKDYVGAESVGKLLSDDRCNALEYLDMRDNRLADEGVAILARTLLSSSSSSSSRKSLSSLASFNVGRNHIGEKGIESLCFMLRTNRTLRSLSVESSHINDRACVYIAEALVENDNVLRILNLKDSLITAVGARSIAEALVVGTKGGRRSGLEELNLSCNRLMGGDGIIAFAEALSSSSSSPETTPPLKILKLDGNHIRTKEASALGTAISCSSDNNLLQLDLRSCYIYADAASSIAEALAPPTCRLQSFNLQGN